MSMTAVTVFGALATFLGTLVGAGVSLLSTGAATRAEWRRQEWQFEAEQLATLAKRRENFESLVRSAAIELSEAWAQVVRSHDGYRQMGTGAGDADAHRSRMVEAQSWMTFGAPSTSPMEVSGNAAPCQRPSWSYFAFCKRPTF